MNDTFPLDQMARAPRNLVQADRVQHAGRDALRVSPLDGLGIDQLVDKPSFVALPTLLTDGMVEVDVLSRLRPDAPDLARAFAGLAFRIAPDLSQFEAVYLRPLNGRSLNPPAPRHVRALQYFAYPDWDFQRLRDAYPDGRYETGADIVPDRWHQLRLVLDGPKIAAFVDGQPVLTVEGRIAPAPGRIGLWVDIGTEAFFSDLRVTPRAN